MNRAATPGECPACGASIDQSPPTRHFENLAHDTGALHLRLYRRPADRLWRLQPSEIWIVDGELLWRRGARSLLPRAVVGNRGRRPRRWLRRTPHIESVPMHAVEGFEREWDGNEHLLFLRLPLRKRRLMMRTRVDRDHVVWLFDRLQAAIDQLRGLWGGGGGPAR